MNVYSGSGSNWPVRTTIKLDGNGDGDYDDAGELLGVEDMNVQDKYHSLAWEFANKVLENMVKGLIS